MRFVVAALFVLVAVPVFAGPKIIVLIDSVPSAAAVYANDAQTYMGVTPLQLVYQLPRRGNCSTRR